MIGEGSIKTDYKAHITCAFLYNRFMKRVKFTSPFSQVLEKEKPVKDTRYRFEIALDSVRDKELIKELERHPNKSQYIRDLIQEDIDAY